MSNLEAEEDLYDSEEDEDFKPDAESDDEYPASGGEENNNEVDGSKKEASKKRKTKPANKLKSHKRKKGGLVLTDDEDDKNLKTSTLSKTETTSTPIPDANSTITTSKIETTQKVEPSKESSSTKILDVDSIMEQLNQAKAKNIISIANPTAPKVKQITETYDFAGETVKITKTVNVNDLQKQQPIKKPQSKLASILSSFDKKKKISTLDKSKLDWDTFKKKEGIEDDLKQQAKSGFLEKQAFLARTDLRQFENEKAVRVKPPPKY